MWYITVMVNDSDVITVKVDDENDRAAIKTAIEQKLGKKVRHLFIAKDKESAYVKI